ncbi:hypothetical protein AB0K74_47640 [Streptomyces sp. NPDC056159]|uniref:hypothetical protein n=1 Tax=Streptomyces sp. NPDC056159 TaxID=3155537 RepID=UPI003417A6FB
MGAFGAQAQFCGGRCGPPHRGRVGDGIGQRAGAERIDTCRRPGKGEAAIKGDGMAESNYQRVRARVVRAGPYTAHVAIPAFVAGQITIPVQTFDLMSATGLSHQQLAGAELTVTANVSAIVDTDVDPHGWQLLATADEHPTVSRSALPAVAV